MAISSASRRAVLFGIGASGLVAGPAAAITTAQMFPVVETAQGRVRGLISGGISVFKGLRYGAETSGKNRFMPPKPPPSWKGVRDAFAYGQISPQVTSDRRRDYADLIMFDIQPGGMGEDCLVLNLWTPKAERGGKRPVLLHVHGGGYYGGSGNSPGFDGEKLARFGDVVTISINHRLGALGYMGLLGLNPPPEFASAGTAGLQDIAAALRWVRDNIDAFGGDPNRVLLYGQSGGGSKTSMLMAMPEAKGLFHRAGIMSGAALRATSPEDAAKSAEALIRQLGVRKGDFRALQAVPFLDILSAQATLEEGERSRGEAPRSFSPVLDAHLPRHPFDPDAPAVSADVPVVIGTTLDERAYRLTNFDLDEPGLRKFVQERAGPRTDQAMALYRGEDPKATPFVLQARVDSDLTFHPSYFTLQERKAAQAKAPIWSYLWKAPSPAYGGRYGAPHGVDVGMSLHDIRGGLNGPSAEQLALADQIASAWVSFAATGDPNNKRLPQWPAFEAKRRATMIFDKPTHVENDPRKAIREFWANKSTP
ncbi:carboxylesterase/lipase family protein [soil metagenome]